MLFAGVTVACGRCFLPLDQSLFALGHGDIGPAHTSISQFWKASLAGSGVFVPCQSNARMLWNENPDPITRIFSCISSRSALPRARSAAGSRPRNSES